MVGEMLLKFFLNVIVNFRRSKCLIQFMGGGGGGVRKVPCNL